MPVRVNVNLPETLYKRSMLLVEEGHFSSLSEVVRDGLRKEIAEYGFSLSTDERRLMNLISDADREGKLLDEKGMKKHGLRI